MATEMPVNGNHMTAGYEHENGIHSASNSISANADYATSTVASTNNAGTDDIPKAEVAWYFVEQYYTTMSKNPEKLFLFYNKRSQYVSGSETEKLNTCVGQKAIDERIKELDLQDSKVRVTNVDSQSSGLNILIQVIGEMSCNNAPQRKFTQTFVLAEQTNGYFVLNDIFRYLLEEDDLDAAEPHQASIDHHEHNAVAIERDAAPTEPEPRTLTNSASFEEREHAASLIDQSLEQAIEEAPEAVIPPPPAAVNGNTPSEPLVVAEEAPVAVVAKIDDAPSQVEDSPIQAKPEKPMEPEPTRATSPTPSVQSKPSTAAEPSKPSAPKTWANLVAANRVAVPVQSAPAPPSSSSSAPIQPKATSSAPVQAQVSAPVQTQAHIPTSTTQDVEQSATPASGSDWLPAPHGHGKKQPRPQSIVSPPENSRAYIKSISENIDPEALKTAMAKFGEVTYVDVSRQKNCAWLDFGSPAAFQAAIAGNPHTISGERVIIEERRNMKQNFGPNFGPRGGAGPRGRGGFAERGGNQGRGGVAREGGRGGFNPRGRGGANPRGRGVASPA